MTRVKGKTMAPHKQRLGLERALLTAATLAIWTMGCSLPCAERILAEVSSPDGKHISVLLERQEATGIVTHVNIRDVSKVFRIPRSGLIEQGEVFAASGTPRIKMEWKGSTRLELTCPECSLIRNQTRGIDGIVIAHAEKVQ